MKKYFYQLFLVFAISFTISNCKSKTEDTALFSEKEILKTHDGEIYNVMIEESTIEWQGFKPTGSHNGNINLKRGKIEIEDSEIHSGVFVIDMNTIKESKGSTRLEGHLKSADFFDVEKFPTAGFEIILLEEKDGITTLSGKLTLKDVTDLVSFPVKITHKDDTLTLTSDVFTIDRSKWNIRYKSKSFFNDLKDKFINDDIELKINIIAKKAIH